jgi:hypothetical protein
MSHCFDSLAPSVASLVYSFSPVTPLVPSVASLVYSFDLSSIRLISHLLVFLCPLWHLSSIHLPSVASLVYSFVLRGKISCLFICPLWHLSYIVYWFALCGISSIHLISRLFVFPCHFSCALCGISRIFACDPFTSSSTFN